MRCATSAIREAQCDSGRSSLSREPSTWRIYQTEGNAVNPGAGAIFSLTDMSACVQILNTFLHPSVTVWTSKANATLFC
jgi:hypothetical protein